MFISLSLSMAIWQVIFRVLKKRYPFDLATLYLEIYIMERSDNNWKYLYRSLLGENMFLALCPSLYPQVYSALGTQHMLANVLACTLLLALAPLNSLEHGLQLAPGQFTRTCPSCLSCNLFPGVNRQPDRSLWVSTVKIRLAQPTGSWLQSVRQPRSDQQKAHKHVSALHSCSTVLVCSFKISVHPWTAITVYIPDN